MYSLSSSTTKAELHTEVGVATEVVVDMDTEVAGAEDTEGVAVEGESTLRGDTTDSITPMRTPLRSQGDRMNTALNSVVACTMHPSQPHVSNPSIALPTCGQLSLSLCRNDDQW